MNWYSYDLAFLSPYQKALSIRRKDIESWSPWFVSLEDVLEDVLIGNSPNGIHAVRINNCDGFDPGRATSKDFVLMQ